MCGIAGIVDFNDRVEEREVITMCDQFPYRGPDDAGHWMNQDASVGFGHRRLSILDTSAAGKQPMTDPRNGNVITYNGEVYNYLEIRTSLEKNGYRFSTGTDTEVILAAYDAYGEKCLSHFNGMFAFAIWNSRKREVFIARDRLGIKPFYYQMHDSGRFLFASEVKALRVAASKLPSVNMSLIDQYMSFGYVPGENTLEDGIVRLLPGHYAVFSSKGLKIHQFWDLQFECAQDNGLEYYVDQGRELLEDAIQLRLRSDVPLGIFLSGGLDSSAVVALLAQKNTEKLKTFSVAYDFGKEYNETTYARQVAKHFDTEHRELFLTAKEFRDFIPDFSYLMDEPVTESAAISLQFLSQLTKDYVTVVLSGEGSDELFAGYDLYHYMSRIEQLRKVLGPTVTTMLGNMSASLFKGTKIAKYSRLASEPLEKRYKGISVYEESVKDQLYSPGMKQLLANESENVCQQFLDGLFEKTRGSDALSRMLYFDTKTWLVDDLLIKADRMSMAASLELRVPFLDYRFVEFAASVPSHHKRAGNTGKLILKKMMKDLLPDEIIHRKKMGFPTPLKLMFQGELADYARETLLNPNAIVRDCFEKSHVEFLLNNHVSGKKDNHREIWQLLVLEEWHQNRGVRGA